MAVLLTPAAASLHQACRASLAVLNTPTNVVFMEVMNPLIVTVNLEVPPADVCSLGHRASRLRKRAE